MQQFLPKLKKVAFVYFFTTGIFGEYNWHINIVYVKVYNLMFGYIYTMKRSPQ